MDDHCGTVMPVVSLPHDSVMVFVSKPLPIALRTGGKGVQPDACRGSRRHDHIVVVPEHIVFFGQKIRHRVTGRDVRQKPERVLEIGQQARVRVWKRRPRTGLQALHRLRRMSDPG